MNRQVIVSIIIPTFNRAYCLKATLQSILDQTVKEFEIIVVDDGSQDSTDKIVRGFPEVKYYRLEENRGVSFARNFGVQLAVGRYISFLDSDDRWLPEKLEYQIGYMKAHPDCLISYTDEIWIRNGLRINPKNKHLKYSGDIFQYCLPLCIVSPSSVMIRSEFFEESGLFDEILPACEDYDLWLRMALRTPFHFISQKLIVKCGGHADQLSKKYWGMDRFRVYSLQKLLHDERLTGENRYRTLKKLQEKCAILNKGFAKRQKIEEAKFYLDLMVNYDGSDNPFWTDTLSNQFLKSTFDFSYGDRSG